MGVCCAAWVGCPCGEMTGCARQLVGNPRRVHAFPTGNDRSGDCGPTSNYAFCAWINASLARERLCAHNSILLCSDMSVSCQYGQQDKPSLVESRQLCEDGQCMKSYGESNFLNLSLNCEECMVKLSPLLQSSTHLHLGLGVGVTGRSTTFISITPGVDPECSVRADDRNCLAMSTGIAHIQQLH